MTALTPLLFGSLRTHRIADAFANEVVRVHKRYATEVVAAHRLCPFVRDVDVAFGRFCVMFSHELSLDDAKRAFIEAESHVLHMVFPLVCTPASEFERFGGEVGRAARDIWRGAAQDDPRFSSEPPVVASFHPLLAGDRTAPHRLIGLLRRAPDPFVQIIPGGHHESGTVVAHVADYLEMGPEALAQMLAKVPPPPKDRAHETFQRLSATTLNEIADTVAEIIADRDRSYEPYLRELGAPLTRG
ncbi:MAG: hypothetical protein IPK82_04935 [Polyangiaceae bacterium]|nr:hypothetical protein [Polyangiaceae bacterium]